MPPIVHGEKKDEPDCEKNGTDLINGSANKQTFDTAEDARKDDFLRGVFQIILKKGINDAFNRKNKVVEFKHPEDLAASLDLGLPENGDSNKKLLQLCEDTVRYSVKTGHPRFFNQLYGGQDLFALAGSLLTENLNASMYTYEVAPVFTLMEEVVFKKLRDIVGYETGDGIFCPGGSVSNMYGLNMARYHKYPHVKEEGIHALPKFCIFTSEQCHYSLKKGVALLGMGTNCIRPVQCTDKNKMDAQKLEEMILQARAEGVEPLMVNATGGTTVMGAYDPLEEIADICEKYGIWMHADCCWGGGALMSKKHRSLLKGVERADSIAWNLHKLMGIPMQCCAFLTKHEGLLKKCHSAYAEYLFQPDKFYDVSYDTGDKSIQCGRKNDVFKFWLMWRAHGSRGLERNIDHVFEMSGYLRERIIAHPGYKLVQEDPECTNVCFWYLPPRLREQPETEEWWTEVGKVAPVVKKRMIFAGSMMITYNPMGSKVNFFRFVLANPASTTEDMDFIIAEIDRLGNDL